MQGWAMRGPLEGSCLMSPQPQGRRLRSGVEPARHIQCPLLHAAAREGLCTPGASGQGFPGGEGQTVQGPVRRAIRTLAASIRQAPAGVEGLGLLAWGPQG